MNFVLNNVGCRVRPTHQSTALNGAHGAPYLLQERVHEQLQNIADDPQLARSLSNHL